MLLRERWAMKAEGPSAAWPPPKTMACTPCSHPRAVRRLAEAAAVLVAESTNEPRIQERPSPTARAWCDFFHQADLPVEPSMRRKSTPGNARRSPQQPSLGPRRRPPRSLSGGLAPSRVSSRSTSGKCTERGREAAPKAGVGPQGPG